jgi:hypothetical protein
MTTLSHLDGLGLVYFAQAGNTGPIRISASWSLAKRITALRDASPYEIVLLGVIPSVAPRKLERRLHKRFDKLRQHGNWFAADNRLLDYIKARVKDPQTVKTPTPDEDGIDPALAPWLATPHDYQEPRPLLTVQQLASTLKLSGATIGRYVQAGLPCLRIGRQLRFYPPYLYERLHEASRIDVLEQTYGPDPFTRMNTDG